MNELALEELNGKNVGFSFLWNPDELQTSATLKLQWCLTPQIIEYLKEQEAMEIQVLICVTTPRGREIRYVVPLDSPQELIEFHMPGAHEISALIFWAGPKLGRKRATQMLLRKSDRYTYEVTTELAISRIECLGGQSAGRAQLTVTVPDGFFAPKLSPSQDWYVNLWFGEPAWDECELRRRKWIAYTVQPFALAMWIPMLFLVRFAAAFWLTAICARTDVPWKPLVHPFSNDTEWIWQWSRRRKLGYFASFLVPVNHLMILAIASGFMLLGGAWNHAMPTARSVGVAYLALLALLFFASVVVCVLSSIAEKTMKNLRGWVTRMVQETGDTGPIAEEEKAEEKDRIEAGRRLERLCADLVCTTAPADRSPRSRRRGFTRNLVLQYHDLKAKVCRPTARSW